VALLLPAALGAQEPAWDEARPDYRWSFPRDHWSHPSYRTEWWYLTGQLQAVDDPDARFGYQFTFFRVGLDPETPDLASAWAQPTLIMGHLAVTDLQRDTHRFAEVLYRTTEFLGGFGAPGDSTLAWSLAPPGTPGRWTLTWNGAGFDISARDDREGVGLSLRTEPAKPLIFQGPNGWSRKGTEPSSASLYYSMTRLVTEGTVTVDERELRVTGESWMDKEFGSNQLDPGQVGWDWFSLRLADGRDLMIYVLRDERGAASHASGTVVDADGGTSYLGPTDWTLEATERWASPETGADYPARWRLTVPSMQLDVEVVPEQAAQENVSALVGNLYYWEGSVRVLDRDGAPAGIGYVELTGYGNAARPAI
jgi:predicted secreted hydrolase